MRPTCRPNGGVDTARPVQMIDEPINEFVETAQGIMRDPTTGAYWGASNHFLDDCALGW